MLTKRFGRLCIPVDLPTVGRLVSFPLTQNTKPNLRAWQRKTYQHGNLQRPSLSESWPLPMFCYLLAMIARADSILSISDENTSFASMKQLQPPAGETTYLGRTERSDQSCLRCLDSSVPGHQMLDDDQWEVTPRIRTDDGGISSLTKFCWDKITKIKS